MYKLMLVFLAALPVIIILLLVYSKDKNKEPLSLLIKLFLSGFVSCGLTLLITELLSLWFPFMQGDISNKSLIQLALYAFLGVALVEEFSKWIMTHLVGYQNREFDELYDGMIYAIFVSLGFAFLENIIYVTKTSSLNVALLRAVSAVPSHACDAIFMGYYLSVAKHFGIKKEKDKERKYILLSIFFPALLHGIYDFCLMSGYKIFMTIFSAFIIFLYVVSVKKLKRLSTYNKKIRFKNKFCKKCGKVVTGEFCSKCGERQY